MKKNALAIFGGPKVRQEPLPYRRLFSEEELKRVIEVFENSWKQDVDFGYQGKYEKRYTDKFCEFQGGGFADAVSSGTAAIYLALKALGIKSGSDVVVSPFTHPGSVSPAVLQGMNIIVADSELGSILIGPEQFKKVLTPNTRAAILTHSAGYPIDIDPILDIAKDKNIKIIEDCSQAHGALYKDKKVGRFGDIAVFSTMFSKNHATGGCGGVVYTENEEYYWLVRSHADRGKPFNKPDFNPRRFDEYLFPALNFNIDELSCAIGISTLSKLPETIEKRLEIIDKIDGCLKQCSTVRPLRMRRRDSKLSPFYHVVGADINRIKVSKVEFAEAIAAEGIWINADCKEVVSEWKWLQPYLKRSTSTPNIIDIRNRTFNILFNERFTDREIDDIIKSIIKVEKYFSK